MTPTLDPNDLVLFAHVAEAGSFTKVAERLGLPKSTLSRRLSAMEALLGERLMLRTTRRLSVTEFGAAVLDHARQVVTELDGAMALAQHRQSRPSGHLRVSMPSDIAMLVLSDTLSAFAASHPDITLELDLSPRRVDLVAENFDLAIRMGALPEDSTLAARRLALFTGGLYASPGWLRRLAGPLEHPQALRDLGDAVHALVIGAPNQEPAPWRLRREATREGVAAELWQGLPARRTLANAPAVLMQMAVAGVGVAPLSEFFAMPALRRGELVRLLPDWDLPPAPAWAVFPERRLMPAKTRVFLDALSEALAPCRAHEPPHVFAPLPVAGMA